MTVGNEISYFVRPVNGSDANDGTSFATAWQTWSHAFDELCMTGVSAGDPNNAILFLVNEGSDYTGPYSGDTTMEYAFTSSGGRFQICGLSADGSFDPKTNFAFDLSGITTSYFMYAFGKAGMGNNGVLWRNITWKNAPNTLSSIMYTSYDGELSGTEFYSCIFEDNECGDHLIGFGSYGDTTEYYDCIIRRNNTYNTGKSLFPAGNYGLTTNRQPGAKFTRCIFDSNQTDPAASQYVTNTNSLNGQGVAHRDNVFVNNGYNTSGVCVFLHANTEQTFDEISNNIFYNNAGTAIFCENASASDAVYGNNVYGRNIFNNVFLSNNKSVEYESEPGLRFFGLYNNIFYNNTVEDIPSLVAGFYGVSGGNFVEDPQFTDPGNLDFSASETSPVWSRGVHTGGPIGGYFVTKISTGGGGGFTGEYVTVF